MNKPNPIPQEKMLRVLAMIDRGTAENPVPSSEIQIMLNLSERELRKVIEEARRQGHLICSHRSKGGYYKAKTWQEYRSTFDEACRFAVSMLKTQSKARKYFARDQMQDTLFSDFEFERQLETILREVDKVQLPEGI